LWRKNYFFNFYEVPSLDFTGFAEYEKILFFLLDKVEEIYYKRFPFVDDRRVCSLKTE